MPKPAPRMSFVYMQLIIPKWNFSPFHCTLLPYCYPQLPQALIPGPSLSFAALSPQLTFYHGTRLRFASEERFHVVFLVNLNPRTPSGSHLVGDSAFISPALRAKVPSWRGGEE